MNRIFLNRMKEYLGSDEYEQFVASYNFEPKKAVIWNTKKKKDLNSLSQGEFGKIFKNEINSEINDKFNESKFLLSQKEEKEILSNKEINGKNYLHHAGVIYISEPSAASVVSHLDIKSPDKVLDLCASPGGKSIQVLNYLNEEDGGFLIANEIVVKRVKILSSNLERMGYKNVIILSESPKNISENFEGYFDKVIVDAPCSGEGLFRRDENAIKEWSLENVKACAIRQKEILDEAYKCVKVGGKLLYSTCTFSKEEDEEVTAYFLMEHNNFKLIYEEKILPHMDKGEGQYIAVFEKI